MATSGSSNYSVSRDDIINRVLRILGVLAQGGTATATQISEAAIALNGLTKALEADGMPLWGITQYAHTMTASTRTYRIGVGQTVNIVKPLKIIGAFLRKTSSSIDSPVMIVTKDEYNKLGNKFITGIPNILYYDPQRVYGDLALYPVPDTTTASGYTLQIVYQRTFEDFDSASDEADFPQEWFDALTFLLADRL